MILKKRCDATWSKHPCKLYRQYCICRPNKKATARGGPFICYMAMMCDVFAKYRRGAGAASPTWHAGEDLWRWSEASWLLCTWRPYLLYHCPLPSNCLQGNLPEMSKSTSLWEKVKILMWNPVTLDLVPFIKMKCDPCPSFGESYRLMKPLAVIRDDSYMIKDSTVFSF